MAAPRPPARPRRPRSSPDERGFSIVVLLGGIAIMMILLGAGAPSWRYVMQDDREQELFFRGDQIARAIEEFQRKNGNTFPPSFEVLVKGKYLRHDYKDPMTKDGKWRILRPGEVVGVQAPRNLGGGGGTFGASPRPSPSTTPSAFGPVAGTPMVGAIAGVASTSHEDSLRLFNGRTKYDEWIFLAGQPRRLGRNLGPQPGVPGLPGAGGNPFASPGTNPFASPATPLRR